MIRPFLLPFMSCQLKIRAPLSHWIRFVLAKGHMKRKEVIDQIVTEQFSFNSVEQKKCATLPVAIVYKLH